jgi:hypothetical protein
MISETAKAYLAGWLDFSKANPTIFSGRGQIQIQVSTVNEDFARFVSSLVGLSVTTVSNKKIAGYDRRPCTDHCPNAHEHVPARILNSTFRIGITGTKAYIFLCGISEYSFRWNSISPVMQEHLSIVRRFSNKGKAKVRLAIDAMKELGWEIPEELLDALEAKEEAA